MHAGGRGYCMQLTGGLGGLGATITGSSIRSSPPPHADIRTALIIAMM